MGTVNIDAKLLEVLQNSTCFGIAYDPDVPECKQCDVKGTCKAKMEGLSNHPIPTSKPAKKETPVEKKETKPATKPKKETKPATKASKPEKKATPKATPTNSGDLPDFKPMSLDELKALARERSVDWKDYGNDQITRMRLIMALKKSY